MRSGPEIVYVCVHIRACISLIVLWLKFKYNVFSFFLPYPTLSLRDQFRSSDGTF